MDKCKKKVNKAKFLVFDFDGTVVNTKALYYQVIYEELKKYGFSYKQTIEIIDLGLNLERTLDKLGFHRIKRIMLGRRIMKGVITHLKNVKECRDVDSIKKLNIKKIIVSNSSEKAIIPIIKHYKLKKYFDGIYGTEEFEDKAEFIEEYLRKNKIKKENCYYVGDRAADVDVAKKIKVNSVIICGNCAWDPKKDVLGAEPDYIVSSIRDLKKII
jgi:phosphoglycolate phosphatase